MKVWRTVFVTGMLVLLAVAFARAQTKYPGLVSGWLSTEADWTTSVAWGDVDGDGDLDLAAGNYGQPSRLYRNDDGVLTTSAAWSSTETDNTRSIAWGDVDGDGDLDLAAGNEGQPNRLYRNDGGVLTTSAVWSSTEADSTRSVAWGDVDGDGDLDLAVGNEGQPNRLYRNDGGVLTTSAVWSSAEAGNTRSIAWGDMDGDGDLDLAAGGRPNSLHRNNLSTLVLNGSTPTIDLQMPGGRGGADLHATADVWLWPTLPITYQLFQPQNRTARSVLGYYSVDGGGRWLPAVPTADTVMTDLASEPYPTANVTNTHVLTWALTGTGVVTGVMGRNDNVVFRLKVIPSVTSGANEIPGPFLHGSFALTTFPFRVRGTQVQAVDTSNRGLSQALVYRLLDGKSNNAQPYADRAGHLYHTDGQGYLQGRGELLPGDSLAALWPVPAASTITFTNNSTLYLTSARPTTATLDMKVVDQPGVQVLTVSNDSKLLLFNLDVALEWDARKDAQFLEQLRFSLARASDLLFDWTNGQAALGQVRIYHDAKRYPVPKAGEPPFNPWTDSHIRIYASNRIRPSASEGGIISPTLALSETVTVGGQTKVVEYGPGQVRMGATWNRYGETSGNLGDDWARALAHELGHYLFFLEDDYLGMNDQGMLVTVPAEGDPNTTCPSAMNDPYRESLSEFQPGTGWSSPGCAGTLAQQSTGRSDWQTIHAFYPFLTAPTAWNANSGPSTQPLAVTQLQEFSPTLAANTVDVPIFSLIQAAGGGTYLPGPSDQAFLFQGDWLSDLGQPTLDQVQAWGARPGDRLCVFEPAAGYFGCEAVHTGDDQLAMEAKVTWQPEITVTPVNSYTIALSVAPSLQAGALCARLYPSDEPAKEAVQLQPGTAGVYASVLPATNEPTLEGYVHVWVPGAADSGCSEPQDSPRLETVTGYAVGGNPIHRRARRTLTRAGGVHRRARRAPVISADGQVMIFGDALDLNQEQEWSFTLQATSSITATPAGRTLVGQAYRLIASPNAPDLAGAAISFGYLGEQVPPGEEGFLRIYFHQPNASACGDLGLAAPCWEPLDTFRDTEYNLASAKTRGPGLYALMAGMEIPLANTGWNNFSYPVQQTQAVSAALASLGNAYTVVYGYQPDQPGDAWKVYGPGAPDWANDLKQLEFGRGYWIHVSRPITLYLAAGGATQVEALSGRPATDGILPAAPSVYYGVLTERYGYSPAADQVLTARINNRICGQTTTQQSGSDIVFMIKVAAEDGAHYSGCGERGRFVSIKAGYLTLVSVPWHDSRQVTEIIAPSVDR